MELGLFYGEFNFGLCEFVSVMKETVLELATLWQIGKGFLFLISFELNVLLPLDND